MKTGLKHIFAQLLSTTTATTEELAELAELQLFTRVWVDLDHATTEELAELAELRAENDRLQAQVEQCQMALATWATDAESFRIDAEVWKERAEKWQEIAIQLSPAQQISSSMPWGKN